MENQTELALKEEQKEKIRYTIAKNKVYRKTDAELLELLEDQGINISRTTLWEYKKDMRENIDKRFQEIAEFELAEEHNLALEAMKLLLKKQMDNLKNPPTDMNGRRLEPDSRISAEIRAIQKDLLDYYGSTELVNSVFKYFKKAEDEEEAKKVDKIEEEVLDEV